LRLRLRESVRLLHARGACRSTGCPLDNAVKRTPENSTPTSFRQWCEEVLKPAVNGDPELGVRGPTSVAA